MSTQEKPKTRTLASYHIFEEFTESDGAKAYRPVGANVQASSADTAIRQNVTKNGVYVAVRARSFKPVTVKVETQTVVKLK
jgi:hypothetical protein